MDPTTTGFLTQLLRAFQNVFANGFGIITPRAQAILGTLAAIEIALAALFWALRGEDFTAPFLRKLLRIGFFAFLVASWPTLTKGTAEGLARIGSLAGGGTGVPLVNDPSRILDQAMVVIKPIQDEIARIQEGPWYQKIAVLAVVFQYTVAELFVLGAFFVLALTCLLTQVEFALVAVLGLILVPWGISNHTAFLAEKAIGAVIAQGVKLMVLSFIIAVYGPVLNTFALSPAPPLMVTWLLAGSAIVMAIIAVHAPAVAGGLLSGSPSLTAGSAAGVAIGAGAAAIGAGVGAAALGRMGAASAAKTITAAGQIHGAGSAAAANSTGAAAAALSTPAVRGGVLAGVMAASTTPAGQAASAGLQRAASTRLGQAAIKFGSAAAANIDRGLSAGASYAAAGVGEVGRMAAVPVTNAGAAVKDAWSQGVAQSGGVPAPAATPTPSPERLEAGRQRFGDAATVAKATTTAIKGATTTSGGGSGNPTIAPTNDES
ncbi:P-type conjugative transfer protein TrbL [Xanthomonas campestris]|uniref:P-type conjugative transfer protein TrbL n=1 Tax=Xanthomonas campestris TaxID=339 RepID=UPI002B225CA7|nr:P-type conjugative transfer protein TrbL [Xanthomonas campestris]MEB1028018.1 P-type conjugative transfer protein TrbL [Xanthomonas campestris pv. campestris]MEA9553655.1 P-type conjugative transfer protein TrbL [Xanthomonas campestris]MEB1101524.1 P-type conjugative transfer protein TrbL [Xanthomonas campestris pv. campestris]MEB1136592.1 P-type conjugative transfer protein TrbL [Xanthomonas campestris pv. campestris]MEB1656419.1 P-type conjugative transfer protein TrbL [Xanthomonas campes